MNLRATFHRSESRYPSRLDALGDDAPPEITVEGALEPGFVVAIVGTRQSSDEAAAFAFELAAGVVACDGIVVSGGALGIDAAAHRGALHARGRTWVVSPSGCEHVYPQAHGDLFAEVPACEGAMIWPFEADARAGLPSFFKRNSVLVALADVVVVVQAGARSGALNAARCAQRLGRPLWVVPGTPWDERFTGCRALLERGARPLTSIKHFLQENRLVHTPLRRRTPAPSARIERSVVRRAPTPPEARTTGTLRPIPSAADTAPTLYVASLDEDEEATVLRPIARNARELRAPNASLDRLDLMDDDFDAELTPPPTSPLPALDPTEQALFDATSNLPRHLDEIAIRARVCTSAAATGLLTLALENVLVEGPEGFFRRGS